MTDAEPESRQADAVPGDAGRLPGRASVPLADIARTFLGLGATSFGGGVVAYLRRALVVRRRWLDDARFLSGLELSQILPGLNATNMSVYMGERLRGAAGALLACLGMMLPGAAVVMVLGALHQAHGDVPDVALVLGGVGAAAVGLTLATTLQIGKRQLRDAKSLAFVALTFVLVGGFRVSLVVVLLTVAPLAVLAYWPRRSEGGEGA